MGVIFLVLIVAQIRQGVVHLREIRYKNATVKITGEVDIEKVKAATIIFFKKVQRRNNNVICKTGVVDEE